MKPIKGTELLKYLRKVTFNGLSGDKFRFDPNGDGPARYNIIHFKQTSPGKFQWIKVGEYMEGELRLNMSGKNMEGELLANMSGKIYPRVQEECSVI
jgi:metabotropic X receptor